MKYIKRTLPIVGLCLALLFLPGMTCRTAQTTAYKTLAAVEATTMAAYTSYLQLVVAGAIPTNSVPAVTRDFTIFQATMEAAVTLAAQGTNAPTTQPVSDAAAKVLTDINLAKGTK